MRISVDRSRCARLGICESIAPHHFEIGSNGELELLDEHPADETIDDVEAAIESCPVEALSLQP